MPRMSKTKDIVALRARVAVLTEEVNRERAAYRRYEQETRIAHLERLHVVEAERDAARAAALDAQMTCSGLKDALERLRREIVAEHGAGKATP